MVVLISLGLAQYTPPAGKKRVIKHEMPRTVQKPSPEMTEIKSIILKELETGTVRAKSFARKYGKSPSTVDKVISQLILHNEIERDGKNRQSPWRKKA